MHTIVTSQLMKRIRKDYALPIDGIHGVGHWARVLENGERLADVNGADIKVVSLFAVLHDSKRENEGTDYSHGYEASLFLHEIRKDYLRNLTNAQFNMLSEACSLHTEGMIESNLTTQTCWDADRLDLGRVGTIPEPEKLCTDAAKSIEIIQWATKRAEEGYISKLILKELTYGYSGVE